jgi:glycosyltransferase involved in cell wall biosynthesis
VVPDVSVVIPTKDRPVLVGRAVASALSQEGPSVEVIVVDDGSAPDAGAAVREVCAHAADRVRYVRNDESIGNPASRNRGLDEATGRLFCTLDDDDEFLPGKLAAQIGLLERFGAEDLIAVAGVELVWSDGRSLRHLPDLPEPARLDGDLDPFSRLSPRIFLNTYLLATDLMRSVGGYDPVLRWGEHTDLFLRLQKVARFAGVPVLGTRVHRDAAPGLARQAWDRKVVGVERILERHADVFARAPRLRAVWLDGLGMALLRTGRRGDAAARFREALRAYPWRPRILRHLVAATTHTEAVLCRSRTERVPA